MSNRFEKSREANKLRKSGKFQEALIFYRELAQDDKDAFAAAGLLHCLRKEGLFEEALLLCEDFFQKHNDSNWCRTEVIWTIIQGKLEKHDDSATMDEILSIAEDVLSLNPEDISTKWRIIRRILKAARTHDKWDIISKWIKRVNPDELSIVPIKDELGRDGWCDQAIWYNYSIRSMIEIGDKEQAIILAKDAINRFPRQKKFFQRLQGIATRRLSKLREAEQIYKYLCNSGRPDWWILHEYAQILKEMEKTNEALYMMCKAACFHKKIDSLVSLFLDIGFLCNELQFKEEARNHFLLCKQVREKQGWSIPPAITNILSKLDKELREIEHPQNLKDSLLVCRKFWLSILRKNEAIDEQSYLSKENRKNLKGKLILGNSERPFCFIYDQNGDSYFCLKNRLPNDIVDGATLVFDAVLSFDKKKNKNSWRAINIRSFQDQYSVNHK